MFKKKICLFLLIISSLMTAQSDSLFHSKVEIKFNLASALLLVPNIGIEVQLSEKFGYQLDTSASFIDNLEGSPFHSNQISLYS